MILTLTYYHLHPDDYWSSAINLKLQEGEH